MASSFLRFLDHTQRRTTVGRTSLDEWSARRRDLYLTTHETHNGQTSMPPVGFEPTISAGERPQTYALDRAAAGTGLYIYMHKFFFDYFGIITNFVYYLACSWPSQDHRGYYQCIHVFQGVSLRLVSLQYGLVFAVFFFGVAIGNTDFSLLLYVQTGSRSHPAPNSLGILGMYPEDKAMLAWSWPLASNQCWS